MSRQLRVLDIEGPPIREPNVLDRHLELFGDRDGQQLACSLGRLKRGVPVMSVPDSSSCQVYRVRSVSAVTTRMSNGSIPSTSATTYARTNPSPDQCRSNHTSRTRRPVDPAGAGLPSAACCSSRWASRRRRCRNCTRCRYRDRTEACRTCASNPNPRPPCRCTFANPCSRLEDSSQSASSGERDDGSESRLDRCRVVRRSCPVGF